MRRFDIRYSCLLLIVLCLLSGASLAQTGKTADIVFMTDFGHVDDSVVICKGVMLGIAPDARITDITHDVPPYSILDGARFLAGVTPYFPEGTVFVVVVDPGVGSKRKAIVAKSKRGQYFVLPDNGLLTLVASHDGIESAHEITSPSFMIGAGISSTFHGRDIFSPAAAHVARGDGWTQAGPQVPVEQLVLLDIPRPTVTTAGLSGTVIGLDGPFGNLVTDVSREEFAKLGYQNGDSIPVTLGSRKLDIPLVKTFSDVAEGKPLFFIDSRGRLSLAVNLGNFAHTYTIKPPVKFTIPAKK